MQELILKKKTKVKSLLARGWQLPLLNALYARILLALEMTYELYIR